MRINIYIILGYLLIHVACFADEDQIRSLTSGDDYKSLLESLIQKNPIAKKEKNEHQGITTSYKAYINVNGRTIKGIWKPSSGNNWGNEHKNEVAAYKLDKLLGLGMIPITIMKKDPNDGIGSFQYFVMDAKMQSTISKKTKKLLFLDYLLGNCDRHEENFLIRGGKEFAIDNGLAFSQEYCDRIKELKDSKPQMYRRYFQLYGGEIPLPDDKIMERLISIPDEKFVAILKHYIKIDEIKLFWKRKEKLINAYKLKKKTTPQCNVQSEPDVKVASILNKNIPTVDDAAKKKELPSQPKISPGDFMLAIKDGDLKKVTELIQKGADVNKAYGRTPLAEASNLGLLDIVNLLIKNGADINADAVGTETPLAYACMRRQPMIAKRLLEAKAKISDRDLPLAVRSGVVETVKFLLEHNPPNKIEALEGSVNNEAIFNLIADNMEKVKDISVFMCYIKNGKILRLKSLFDKRIFKINKKMLDNAILEAVKNKQLSVLSLLIEKGADVNTVDSEGNTPLLWAARIHGYDALTFVDLLRKHGADLYRKNKYGQNVIDIATENFNSPLTFSLQSYFPNHFH